MMASTSVLTTSSIEILTNCEVSYGISYFTPCGKNFDSSAILAFTSSAVCSALAVGDSCTPMAAVGLPSRRAAVA
jgi:hypothetical protein